jgi:hypothetical protein
MGCSINEGPQTGSAAYDAATGEITLRGSGSGFGDAADDVVDQGYFLSQAVEGDVQITARMLTRPTGGGSSQMAGLMIQESLDADARNLILGILPTPQLPDRLSGLVRQWRNIANDPTHRSLSIKNAALKLPIVLRLTRKGDTITPEYSTDDGQTFQADPAVTFAPPLARTLHVGLVITGGTGFGPRDRISQATFSGVEIQKL